MIDVSVQTDNLIMLKEALESNCDGIRFGSEFCEWKLSSSESLEKAYTLTNHKDKDFVYVTPRVSDGNLEKIRDHLDFLNRMEKIDVVINDFGTLNILEHYPNLRPILGRQLIYIPARCPWEQITEYKVSFQAKRKVEKIFNKTSLNYEPTIRLFQSYGVQWVDVDWIPQCFPNYTFLVKNGLDLSVHLHFVPIAIARRCHTARFLEENSLEYCSRPCQTKAFLLKQDILDIKFFLYGNTVFQFAEPSRKGVKQLRKSKITRFVITVSPITRIRSRREIDLIIHTLQTWCR